MTYTYAYKTSDGKRHEAEIDAESREAVFETLRAKGIRPIKVVAADGSKANGAPVVPGASCLVPGAHEAQGTKHKAQEAPHKAQGTKHKAQEAPHEAQGTRHKAQEAPHKAQGTRHKALIPLILIGLIGLALYSPRLRASLFSALKIGRSDSSTFPPFHLSTSSDTTRRQVIGDAFVIEKGIRTGWSDVFAHEGERFLASFAIPGVPAAQRTSTEDELRAALERKILPQTSDSLEAQQIKAMVEGMKDELRRFVAAGGTIAEYGRRLVQRQEEDLKYYNLVKNELDAAAAAQMPQPELLDLWERRNEDLRQMGIRLVPMPE